ncbi:unnamed protein product [Timema podura]|uniref:Uncharacterized protein n=1 Tax=Timema podura TaxID=61482 RepID=A0ABN7PJD6_TIMPD|nr:unnamed protein product [Timema podura]
MYMVYRYGNLATIEAKAMTSIGLCIAYYIMFLGTLSALFAAMMYIALANISQMDTPWYQLEMSIIGASPGTNRPARLTPFWCPRQGMKLI